MKENTGRFFIWSVTFAVATGLFCFHASKLWQRYIAGTVIIQYETKFEGRQPAPKLLLEFVKSKNVKFVDLFPFFRDGLDIKCIFSNKKNCPEWAIRENVVKSANNSVFYAIEFNRFPDNETFLNEWPITIPASNNYALKLFFNFSGIPLLTDGHVIDLTSTYPLDLAYGGFNMSQTFRWSLAPCGQLFITLSLQRQFLISRKDRRCRTDYPQIITDFCSKNPRHNWLCNSSYDPNYCQIACYLEKIWFPECQCDAEVPYSYNACQPLQSHYAVPPNKNKSFSCDLESYKSLTISDIESVSCDCDELCETVSYCKKSSIST